MKISDRKQRMIYDRGYIKYEDKPKHTLLKLVAVIFVVLITFTLIYKVLNFGETTFNIGIEYDTIDNSSDLDLAAFELTDNNTARTSDDLVFYNNIQSADGAISLSNAFGNDRHQTIKVDTIKINEEAQKIVVVASLYKGNESTIESVDSLSVVVEENDKEVERIKLDISGNLMANSIILAEIVKNPDGTWKCNRDIQYTEETMQELCEKYGLDAEYK